MKWARTQVSDWWANSTDKEKLEQIDAAIELGLSYSTVAWNFRVNTRLLIWFCKKHDRRLRYREKHIDSPDGYRVTWAKPSSRAGRSASHFARRAYFEGESDFWQEAA